MSYETVSCVDAICRTIAHWHPAPCHHDNLTEALIPIFGTDEFNEPLAYVKQARIVRQVEQSYVLAANTDY